MLPYHLHIPVSSPPPHLPPPPSLSSAQSRNVSICSRPIPFYFRVAKATRAGSLQLLQEAYTELLEARGVGRGRVLVEEEGEPCNEKVTQVAVGLMQLAVDTEKLFPKVAEVVSFDAAALLP